MQPGAGCAGGATPQVLTARLPPYLLTCLPASAGLERQELGDGDVVVSRTDVENPRRPLLSRQLTDRKRMALSFIRILSGTSGFGAGGGLPRQGAEGGEVAPGAMPSERGRGGWG